MQDYMDYGRNIMTLYGEARRKAIEAGDQNSLPSFEAADRCIEQALIPALKTAKPDVDENTITLEAYTIMFAYAFYHKAVTKKLIGRCFKQYTMCMNSAVGSLFPSINKHIHVPFETIRTLLPSLKLAKIPQQHIPRILVSFYDAMYHLVVTYYEYDLDVRIPPGVDIHENLKQFVHEFRGVVAQRREYALKLCTLSCLSPELLAMYHLANKGEDFAQRDQLVEELMKVHSTRADEPGRADTEKTCIARFVLNEYERTSRETDVERYDSLVLVIYRLAKMLSSKGSEAEKQLKSKCIEIHKKHINTEIIFTDDACKKFFSDLLKIATAPAKFDPILRAHSEKFVDSFGVALKGFYERTPRQIYVKQHPLNPPLKRIPESTVMRLYTGKQAEMQARKDDVDQLRKKAQMIEDTESEEYRDALVQMRDMEHVVEDLHHQLVTLERDLRGIVQKNIKRSRVFQGIDDQDGTGGPRRRIEPGSGAAADPDPDADPAPAAAAAARAPAARARAPAAAPAAAPAPAARARAQAAAPAADPDADPAAAAAADPAPAAAAAAPAGRKKRVAKRVTPEPSEPPSKPQSKPPPPKPVRELAASAATARAAAGAGAGGAGSVFSFKTSLTNMDPIFMRFGSEKLKTEALQYTLTVLNTVEKIGNSRDNVVKAIGDLKQPFRTGDKERIIIWSHYHDLVHTLLKDEFSDEVKALLFAEGNFTALIALFALLDEETLSPLRLTGPKINVSAVKKFVDDNAHQFASKKPTVDSINAMRLNVAGVGYPPSS